MRKTLATMALLGALMFTTSCVTGPYRLSRTWDDYYNQKYTESAWLHGVLLAEIIPVYPIVGWFMTLGDVIVVNTWTFWSKDAWDNHGTGFNHKALTGATRSVTGYGME
jgi:hypothetical protein